jgi:predicted lactoylglutathione lyase
VSPSVPAQPVKQAAITAVRFESNPDVLRCPAESTLGLSADSRDQVDDMGKRAVAAGGRAMGDPVDQGPMYMRAFLDLDGHRWSTIHFDVLSMPSR